jgi:hypothetical protein
VGTIVDAATGTFAIVVPAGTMGGWPRRCRWAVFFDAEGGGEAELLAEGHLHVRPMVSRAITPTIMLTDSNPAVLTDPDVNAIFLAGFIDGSGTPFSTPPEPTPPDPGETGVAKTDRSGAGADGGQSGADRLVISEQIDDRYVVQRSRRRRRSRVREFRLPAAGVLLRKRIQRCLGRGDFAVRHDNRRRLRREGVVMPLSYSTPRQTAIDFTSTATWIVPGGVSCVFIDGVGGGGGGGGGQAAASAGGGGGGSGTSATGYPLSVAPGSSVTITVGAAGTGGAIATAGGAGGDTVISGTLSPDLLLGGGKGGNPGAANVGGAGGAGGGISGGAVGNGAGGAAGAAGAAPTFRSPFIIAGAGGGGGGNTAGNAGSGNSVAAFAQGTAGTGSAAGGSGAASGWGRGANGGGGTSPSAGGAATIGFGAGGGGGGTNFAGGAGTAGWVRVRF